MDEQTWQNTGVQLPPGWHERMIAVAREMKLTKRALYVAAVYHLLSQPYDDIIALARRLRDAGDDDFPRFCAMIDDLPHSGDPAVRPQRSAADLTAAARAALNMPAVPRSKKKRGG